MLMESEVRLVLKSRCDRAGSCKAWAIKHGVSQPYVCDVIYGRRYPGEKILKALGLRRVIGYEKI